MFTYYADAPTIVHCATGLTYPVAQEADYLALERAYLEYRPGPAEPLFVTLDATIAIRPPMEGTPRPTVIVDALGRTWPGEDCSRAENVPGLTGVYWRISALGDSDLSNLDGRQEPYLVFREGGERFNASVGCNTKLGGFSLSGTSLTISQVASTMMACPDDTVAMLDSRLDTLLPSVASYEIGGRTLLLLDADGEIIARSEAVYLP
jgi:heat shock protein HslJ